MMDELLEQFVIEGRDLITQAEAALERLATTPGDLATIDDLFRTLHTLKGSVQIFNLAPAERLLHAAESRLTVARKSGVGIDPACLAALIACIDQTDRWIDEMEHSGRLGESAGAISDRLVTAMADQNRVLSGGVDNHAASSWLEGLKARAGQHIENVDGPLIAFAYAPDKNAFFRGDDPMAVAAAVPGLEYLSIDADGEWPSLDDWDPFRCYARIEGFSSASGEEVRAAFKLVLDQVEFDTIAGDAMDIEERDTASVSAVRTIRVDAGRIDRLADEVGELIVAANGLAHAVRRAERADPELAASLRAVQADVERIGSGLHQAVAAIRLVPLAPTLRKLPRLVREIAAAADKKIAFEMRGDKIEVDKQIADGLFEPLLHIIRNAIDHGIESAALRKAADKSETGHLILAVTRQGDEVVVSVTDDGAGINPAHIREVAIERGLLGRDAANEMSDTQALRLILRPGFSTARTVTDLSGRGVGMDAVKVAADRLRGRVIIESRPGTGTTFELRLPLDAITTRLLVVRAGAEHYGVPLDQILETARVDAAAIHTIGRGQVCVLRDRTVPVLDLPALMGAKACTGEIARLLVTESGGEPVAIRVEGFDRRIDAIVRENVGLLQGVPGMAGSALLSDGAVLLVLDLPELVA